MIDDKNKNLEADLEDFLQDGEDKKNCPSGECIIKSDGEIVEVVNKKYITDDGRQLLI
jgi:tRNA(Arg) A34 adenosine deaminase TadA|tara:strand:+ start:324 stop:497 length:174 start_codon:yes stop_codon:yes gene_type:complete